MWLLGIDLGGTTIKAGLVDIKGQLQVKGQVPTGATEGAGAVLERIAALAGDLARRQGLTRQDIKAAGIGIPGSVEVEKGLVRLAPNLFWRDFSLRAELAARLNLPVAVDNDAHVAALGEMWQGAGKGFNALLMVTIGTGIGSGLIIDGHIQRGVFGYGAEMGHVKMVREGPQCHCGGRGCLETLASATAMVRRFREYLAAGQPSRLQDSPDLGAREILTAAAGGDELASRVVDFAASYLGMALANAVLLAGPEAIIIGGGPAQAGEVILAPIRKYLAEYLGAWQIKPLPVLAARLGNEAGIIGAARLALELLEH
ncbi:Glucokinase [Neomoorella glycerini]|uniref:Glucokinase n=1 Tax=Neomoorella glycerini TaxID=55779 RepID=A0A6I5ZT88_9FIRM|nr:ROK family protein [Moorella glycerini]QGP92908.1 Glucokinase [Moorella glycerini]